MNSTIEKNLLELDDCFPDGCIVDGSDIDMTDVEQLMYEFLSNRK